jgi:hypothetical protein
MGKGSDECAERSSAETALRLPSTGGQGKKELSRLRRDRVAAETEGMAPAVEPPGEAAQ